MYYYHSRGLEQWMEVGTMTDLRAIAGSVKPSGLLLERKAQSLVITADDII